MVTFADPNRLGDDVACDTETTGLSSWHGDRVFAISAYDTNGNGAYVQWDVDPFTREVKYDRASMKRWQRFLKSGRTFRYFNGKFDRRMLGASGLDVEGQEWHDALLALKCVNSGLYTYQLKPVAERLLGYPKTDEADLSKSINAARREGRKLGWDLTEGKKGTKGDMFLADPRLVKRYALGDAERTLFLWHTIAEELDDVREVYAREMAIQPWLDKMEHRGVMIDPEALATTRDALQLRVDDAHQQLMEYAWDDFNPDSPIQVCQLLYEDLGIPVPARGKASKRFPEGQPKTGRAYLEQMDHPAVLAMMEHRRISKLLQFCEQWGAAAVDNVIHTNINAAEAVTGRMSTDSPNLQQVPKRDPELAKLIRTIFVPRPGYVWLCADYSQMELRMLAGLANEGAMLDAFANGRDIHEETMKKVFPESKWKSAPEQCRTAAKGINFGILYGIGKAKLGRELGISPAAAQGLIDRFKEAFPRVAAFMSESISLARKRGTVQNPFGRRMTVPRDEPYKATNYRIQGSGADVIKVAIPRIGEMYERNGIDAHMLLPVHDELVNEVRRTHCRRWVARGLRDLMEDHGNPALPHLPVDVDLVTRNWGLKDGDWANAA